MLDSLLFKSTEETLDDVIVKPAIDPPERPLDIPERAVEVEVVGVALPETVTEPETTLLIVMASTFVLFSPIRESIAVMKLSILLRTCDASTPEPLRVREKPIKMLF